MSSAKDDKVQVTFRGVSLANEDFNFVPQPYFAVNPRTTSYRLWEAVSAICIFLTCLLVPYQASFESRDATLWVFVYIFDVLFLADVLLKFRVGYFNKGTLVTDKSLVSRRYLRTKFVPDLLTLIPLDLLVFGVQTHLEWHQLLTLVRLNRILRVYRLASFFGARENELGTNTALIRALKYAAIGTITIHVMSCVWYSLACANEGAAVEGQIRKVTSCDPDSWAIKLNTGIGFVNVGKRYVLSLYWATATATSTGYGDLHAATIGEKWFSIFAMLTGIGLFFGFILGGMASMLTNLDSRRMRYTHHFDVIKDHMRDMKISSDIRSRVLAYYAYLWTHNRGENGDGMFSDLPLTFQAELSLSINKKVLEKAPLFRGLNPGFRRMLSLVIRPVFYMPNQIIANKGDIGHHMFYIHRGRAEILCENENEVLVTLKEGKLFGEVSMVYNLPRATSVRAASPCVVFLLDRVDLNRVLRHYPAVAEQLYLTLEHRCDLNNIGTLGMEAGSNKDEFLEMENGKAEAWLRQSADFKEDTSSKESLLARFSRHVIMPDSWFAVIWERLLLSVLLFICFVYTFVASFSISLHALGYGEGVGSKALMSFTYLLDAVLVADFIMRFNMASGTTTEIEDVRKSYRRSLLFWIDLLAILPIEIFALSQDDHHKIWHSLAFLRLNRLIKAVRIPRFFSNLENNLHYNIGRVRAVKFTIYIILITHISACVWFLGACFRETCTEGSWAQHTGNTHRIAGFGDYISSLYWAAATMSSTGYGDIHAHNMESQLIATVVMLTGLLLYGYCLSSIAATLANSAAPKVEFFARMTATREFMAEQNLSRHLMERTETYLAMLWRVHRGEATPGGRRLIEDMPLSLQMDVTYEETKDYLEKAVINLNKGGEFLRKLWTQVVPIFMETDAIFLRELSLKVTSYLFSPGDYIVYAGDMGREMYCVRRGLVEVIADDDKGTGEATVVATLGPGAYFGEIGLIFGENRLATVKAKTFCEILMLTKPDLDEVLVRFPIVARQIYDAGVNSDHLKNVRQAAFESTKAAVRRLSMKCANQERSSVMSKSQTSKKKKEGRVSPEMSAMRTGFMPVTNESEEDVNKPYDDLYPIFWLFSRLLMRHSISPDSHYFIMWQGLSLVIAGIFTFTLTLQAAFLHTATSLWIVNYCFDFLCLVDMYIKFHLAFYNDNNVLVTHPIYTARNYLRRNFPLDLLCSFPTDIIVLAIWPVSLGVLRILALARLNRCLYMYKTQQFFHFMTKSIGKNTNLLGQLKVALYMATFTHCIACGWFLLACKGLENGDHSCAADSWVEQGNRTLATNSFGEQYITSLYWAAATSASVGYGDIHAYNTTEMTFALFCMIIGIVFYGYIIASVAAGLANADAQRARYQERLDAIKTFLEEQEISEKLTTRVISYYEYLWLRNKGVDASSLFEGLPLALQADISVSLYKDMIERVPLFEGTEIGFLKMLSMKVKPVYFLAKEYIVRKGDIGQEMYFIHRGTVEVVSEHDEPIVFDTMGEGRFFGEISVVFSCPRTASIRAQTNSDVFVLTKKDLDEVLSHYPQIRKKILETAEERQRMVAERAKAFAKKKEEDKKREEENKLKEQEEGHNDQASLTFQIEEPAEPTPTTGQRILTNLWNFKARLTELFVHFVILPNSKWRLIKYVNCVFVFATTLTITYMAAFQDHPWYLIAFNYLCEFSFYAEIYLNFNMAYTNNIGEVISDGRTLLINYAKGKLPLDSLASFPIDIFALAAPADEQLFVLSYLRLLHLIRVVRMQQFFSELAQRLNIDVFRVRMTKFFFQLVIVIHVFACAWYGLACPLNDCSTEENWIKLEDLLDAPALSRYCTAVYWVVATMTSTGYGDIHGDSSSEMALASFVMIFGKLLFGFILGNIASTLANAEIRRVKYEEKLDAIQAHMSDQDIPEALQNRVMDFYEFIWNKNKGIDHGTLFYDMPLCMNSELCLGIVKDILYAVPFLENTELPFIRLLSTKVKPANFHASEYIVRKGDIGQEMFIIRKGLVEVVTEEDPPEVIETLEKGDYFGEMFLIHACPQKMSLRAVTHVDMLVLSKEDLDALLVHDLHVAKQVSEVAERLYPNPSKTK